MRRIYSFLDPRHYLAPDSHEATIDEGRTDAQGTVTLSLPSDLPSLYVCLNDKWYARKLSANWEVVLTREECLTRASAPGWRARGPRPLVRMERK